MHLILLILLLPLASSSNIYAEDFGRIIEEFPKSVLKPTTPANISNLLKSIYSSPQSNVTVAPRGAGHSTHGQAQTAGGIVIDMTSLPSSIRVDKTYVDAGGGALWIDVLSESLKYGLSPRSWTDYLYITVGGTLSNAGVSGQTFKYGPQISNVIELDIVTGKGEQITCSEHNNSDIFYGSLGGLGQFGIITRARIILEPAPKMVKRVEVSYTDFQQFTKDQELLISKGEVDYVEGFVNLQGNSSQGPDIYYTIELGLYYNDKGVTQKMLDQVLPQLGFVRSMVNVSDVSYFEFLNRVRATEEELRKKGLWEVAHPWVDLLVPRAHIQRLKDLVLETISNSYFGGPIIIYPILRHKWNQKMSAMLPHVNLEDDFVYLVSILRSAPPSCQHGSQCLDTLLSQNKKIIDIATSESSMQKSRRNNVVTQVEAASNFSGKTKNVHRGRFMEVKMVEDEGGMGAKQYLPYWKDEEEWKNHFGDMWDRFKELKNRFDPLNVLTPGQRIFQRIAN